MDDADVEIYSDSKEEIFFMVCPSKNLASIFSSMTWLRYIIQHLTKEKKKISNFYIISSLSVFDSELIEEVDIIQFEVDR